MDPNVGRPVLTDNPESEAYKLVHDEDDFNDIRNDLTGYFVLAGNIDLGGYSSGDGWDAIGKSTTAVENDLYPEAFKGILDGGPSKNTVSGISYDNNTENYKGLFGTTDMATIKNLSTISNGIEAKNNAANLVGAQI